MMSAPVAADTLTFLTESNPPNNYLDKGKVAGIATEVLAEAAKRAKLAPVFELGVWRTVYIRAQAERDTCVYSTARLDTREKLYKWVGPIAASKWALYALPGFTGTVANLQDARKYRVGGVANDAKLEFLMGEGVTRQSRVDRDEENPARLTLDLKENQKIDLWITEATTAASRARAAKVKEVKELLVVKEQDLWLACNPRTAPETLKALSEAIDALKADGTAKAITAKYEALFR
jgi:polar amino acid transport system substrate-binding protein